MARGLRRGEIWMYEFRKPDKLRPVVILSRDEATAVMHTVIVAPITSTIRGIPSEVIIGEQAGLKHKSAVSLDHPQTVEQSALRKFVGTVDAATLRRICAALAVALACDEQG